jgi:hypothetical protein
MVLAQEQASTVFAQEQPAKAFAQQHLAEAHAHEQAATMVLAQEQVATARAQEQAAALAQEQVAKGFAQPGAAEAHGHEQAAMVFAQEQAPTALAQQQAAAPAHELVASVFAQEQVTTAIAQEQLAALAQQATALAQPPAVEVLAAPDAMPLMEDGNSPSNSAVSESQAPCTEEIPKVRKGPKGFKNMSLKKTRSFQESQASSTGVPEEARAEESLGSSAAPAEPQQQPQPEISAESQLLLSSNAEAASPDSHAANVEPNDHMQLQQPVVQLHQCSAGGADLFIGNDD